MLGVKPVYSDDMAHRVELLKRYFPADYPAAAAKVAEKETAQPKATSRVPYKGPVSYTHLTLPTKA